METGRVMKMLVFLVLFCVAVGGMEVSAQTHHVVGGENGWGSASGRVFRVGDKIWFAHPATEESIAELGNLEDFLSCDLTNPIRMYTDGPTHVTLEKEGVRYFTSANPESCKKGLKLPVPVHGPGSEPRQVSEPDLPFPSFDQSPPSEFFPSFDQPPPSEFPTPTFSPPHFPPHTFSPPDFPPPSFGPPDEPHPRPPVSPPPPSPFVRPPPPSASTHLSGLSIVMFAGLALSYMGL